ncbi:peptidase M19 [Pseudohongiella acticola]|uniref:Peptidase M19 n=1 Tax=Pseudohongiella acticola TaxID=1524254 RepID=A0A1E8CNP4_9GAMM|nr:dipeptidase [Pseudohongiella acticola]OFE13905.1 peptidase M19 [Pseudohongiella acticola]
MATNTAEPVVAEPAATSSAAESEEALIERARGIHERVIVMDTHVDINTANFASNTNYVQDLDTQVNLPKMEAGGMDVAWFVVYTGQGPLTEEGFAAAEANALDKFSAIQRLTSEIAPDQIELALTSDDVRRIVASGKKVAMIGVENSYPMGMDINNVRRYYQLGARYASLSHNGHSQFADSNTGENDDVWLHEGLSDLGRQAIAEMNKWGIIIDVSHPSYESNKETIELSRAPVMASHSSARALDPNVSRNLYDDELQAIRDSGGVVQAVAFRGYVDSEKQRAYSGAMRALQEDIAEDMGFTLLSPAEVRALDTEARVAYQGRLAEIGELAAPRMAAEVDAVAPPVDVSDFVDHIDYIVELIGVDHVGISGDFDGGGGVTGWADASESFNVTLEMVRRGYSEEDIAKIWGENVLRVLDEVQRVAQEIQAAEGV